VGQVTCLSGSSLGIRPRPETYQELGGLLEQLKDKETALHCYRKGMLLMASETAATPAMPAPVKQAALPRVFVT